MSEQISDAWHSDELHRATNGLLFTSEGDLPFQEVSIAGGASSWPLTPDRFAVLIGEPGAPVVEWSLDRLFARHIELVHPSDVVLQGVRPRFLALRDLLHASLQDLRVFRIGEVNVRYYIVGADAARNLTGIIAQALET
ncbi:MAG: Nuclease inhibitor family protein [Gemmatimonadetes bacterium]|nr:Nuclease inhibitor family protein [Gemmatimonadota bacterium]